jgi:hypothetical protein
MRTLVIRFATALGLAAAAPYAMAQCGFPGIKPLIQSGCADMVPECMCSQSGSCALVWRCVPANFGNGAPAYQPPAPPPFITNNPALDSYFRTQEQLRRQQAPRCVYPYCP